MTEQVEFDGVQFSASNPVRTGERRISLDILLTFNGHSVLLRDCRMSSADHAPLTRDNLASAYVFGPSRFHGKGTVQNLVTWSHDWRPAIHEACTRAILNAGLLA